MSTEHCPYCNTLVGVTQMSSTHVRCQDCGREFPCSPEPSRPSAPPPSEVTPPLPRDDLVNAEAASQQQHRDSGAADFYYLSGLAVIGPLTGIELREAAFAEKVVSETLVTNNVNGPWVAANRVKGLFDPHGRPLPHPPTALREIENLRKASADFTSRDSVPPPFVAPSSGEAHHRRPQPSAVAAYESPTVEMHVPRLASLSESLQPSGWGATSFFIGALTAAIACLIVVMFIAVAFKSDGVGSSQIFGFAFGLTFFWMLCIPVNIAGMIAGVVGLTQPERKQTFTFIGLALNGISVLFFLYLLFQPIAQ